VDLTHRGWESTPDADGNRDSYDSGWDVVLGRVAAHAG
jgi:hypothetical protein